ncbi:hypothetical protein K438DRAFT_1776745 [Mycena galopus ATCC 62051]|nr:hypothetical protein K438DRAFT_1776745 [Mycena galopus ATCC 62051]
MGLIEPHVEACGGKGAGMGCTQTATAAEGEEEEEEEEEAIENRPFIGERRFSRGGDWGGEGEEGERRMGYGFCIGGKGKEELDEGKSVVDTEMDLETMKPRDGRGGNAEWEKRHRFHIRPTCSSSGSETQMNGTGVTVTSLKLVRHQRAQCQFRISMVYARSTEQLMRSEGGEDDLHWGAANVARSEPPRAWESADLIVFVLTDSAPASSSSSSALPSVVASAERSNGSWTRMGCTHGQRRRIDGIEHSDLQSFSQEGRRHLRRGASRGRTGADGEDTVGAGDRGSNTRTFTWRGILVRNRTMWRSGRIGVNHWGGEKSHVAADRAVLNEVRHASLRTAKTSGAVRDVEAGKLAGECIVGFGVQRNRKLTALVADPVQVAEPKLELPEGQEQRSSGLRCDAWVVILFFASAFDEDKNELLPSATSMAKARDNSDRWLLAFYHIDSRLLVQPTDQELVSKAQLYLVSGPSGAAGPGPILFPD